MGISVTSGVGVVCNLLRIYGPVGFRLGNLALEFPFLFPKLETVPLSLCTASDSFLYRAQRRLGSGQ